MTATPALVDDLRTVARPARGEHKPKRSLLKRKEGRVAFLFLLPWLLGLIGLTLGPMIYSLFLSFTKYNLLSAPQWIGLDNFIRMGQDARYWESVRVTLLYVVISVPVVLIVSMAVALMMNASIRFITGYRALFYLPSLLGASVAIATLWRQIFGDSGLVNNLLALVGIHHGSWIGDPSTSLGVIISLNAWAFGSTMIIFLAGLRQVPQSCTRRRRSTGPGGSGASSASPCRS